MSANPEHPSAATRLGKAMAAARIAAGFTTVDAAAFSGRTRQLVSLVETGGVAEPSAEMLARLASTYGVDVVPWFKIIGYHHLVNRCRKEGAKPSRRKPVSSKPVKQKLERQR